MGLVSTGRAVKVLPYRLDLDGEGLPKQTTLHPNVNAPYGAGQQRGNKHSDSLVLYGPVF